MNQEIKIFFSDGELMVPIQLLQKEEQLLYSIIPGYLLSGYMSPIRALEKVKGAELMEATVALNERMCLTFDHHLIERDPMLNRTLTYLRAQLICSCIRHDDLVTIALDALHLAVDQGLFLHTPRLFFALIETLIHKLPPSEAYFTPGIFDTFKAKIGHAWGSEEEELATDLKDVWRQVARKELDRAVVDNQEELAFLINHEVWGKTDPFTPRIIEQEGKKL